MAKKTDDTPTSATADGSSDPIVLDDRAPLHTAPRGDGGLGLRLNRYFTTEGVHPYDEIEWELRDAVIKNWRDGSISFEQRGVEFPTTWSMNATTIVAQKYFRGQLGTPERERSVRQIVDRVADTITAWGLKDGYFADAESAEIYNAELKHLLVTQKAAFNSPVWFNIGVPGVPQQASACQPYDALVSTPHGMVPIGELVETNAVGTKVFDAHGVTKIVAVKHNGQKRVLRIHLKAGGYLDVTPDHLVWRASGRDTGSFVEAGELAPGDMLTWHRRESWGEGEVDPTLIAEAALAGWLQSDGFVGQYEQGTNRSLTIEAMVVTEAERSWVLDALDRVFPDVHRHERTVDTEDSTLDCRRIRLYGEGLRDFVERWGLLERRLDMQLPAQLLTAPLPVVAAYVRSVFQAEGYVSIRERAAHVCVDMISEGIVRGLQTLLARFGIFSRVRFKADARDDRHGCWSVAIGPVGDRSSFEAHIGFIDPAKADKLSASLELDGIAHRDSKRLTIDRIEDRGVQTVYDIQTESGEYLSANLRVHNCFILSVEDTMSSILNWYREEGTIFKGGSGAGVNLSAIRSSKEPLQGGGSASGPVSFMRGADASAGTIKSGGKCFRQGTLVGTPSGLVPIESLKVGDVVLTHAGARRVADFMPNGVKQCFLVRTKEGYEVEVTTGHKFAYWDREAGDYAVKPIEEFAPGDALHVLVEPSLDGEDVPLVAPATERRPHETTTCEMVFPTQMSPELAYMLGLFYGDGEVRTEYPYRVRVAFAKDDAGYLSAERFRKFGRHVFGEEPIELGDYAGYQVLGYTRKRLVEFLSANGIAKGKAEALDFPPSLFRAHPEVRAAFIAGYIDADGTFAARGGWSISSIDRAFLVEIQRLLLSLGVASKIKLSRAARGNWQALYRLKVVGATFVDLLNGWIRPYSAKAEHNPDVSDGADKGWGYRPSLYRDLRDRARSGGTLLERTVGAANATTGYGAIRRLIDHPDDDVATYAAKLSRTVQVTLESVEPTVEDQTYDIEVEGAHLLCANGIYASNTRRAAKMVILNVDHPDVEDFIWCKASEERKARVLREAGFDMDLDGADSHSIQYQNANNSVRVTDEFMKAYEEETDYDLRAVTTGEALEQRSARDVMRQIAEAAWECADPGMQYDTTINDWHTAPESGRINGSNPCCFVGETLVDTADGLIEFERLEKLASAGQPLPEVRAFDRVTGKHVLRPIMNVWVAGEATSLVEVVTIGGLTLVCTPEHRFLTAAGTYVEARLLEVGTELRAVDEHGADATDVVELVRRQEEPEPVPVYDLEVEGTHNFGVTSASISLGLSVIVHNSEYMHLDNSACNLASLNLKKFYDYEAGRFDVEAFKRAVEVVFLGQEILVGNSSYPTEKIGENARAFRELGLGYANLGGLLMSIGLPYDSDEGRAWAGAITALMTGHAYRSSAEFARVVGVFDGYKKNEKPMLRVIGKHRDAVDDIDPRRVPEDLLEAARTAWDEALALGERHGYRNSQASVLAPTGTIGLMMDCDTTGIEPDLALVKTKKLVGGGSMQIVNQSIPAALEHLGYNAEQAEAIIAHIDEHKTIDGAPALREEHRAVFQCAMGDNAIHYMGHVKMMAAAQPFLSGAISKTVNVPEEATVEDVEQLFYEGWKLGLKAIAIYRDNCKVGQPLSVTKKAGAAAGETGGIQVKDGMIRRKLPKQRPSQTISFQVGDAKGYLTAGEYPGDGLGEIFLKLGKQGSTLSGVMDAFAISVSLGLQYGVPLDAYIEKFMNMRFEPAGMTDDPDVRFATSIVDYIARKLAIEYLPADKRAALGIATTSERTEALDAGGYGDSAEAAVPETATELPQAPAPANRVDVDAPMCFSCGIKMKRAGACHVCESCGTTSGCS